MNHSRYMAEKHTSYANRAKAAVVSPGQGQQVKLFSINLLNMSGQAMDMGVLIKRNPTDTDFYQQKLIDAPHATLDNSIKAGNPLQLVQVATDSGFMIQADREFNFIGFNCSTAEAIADLTFSYYNGAAFVPLTTYILGNLDLSATGEVYVVFAFPEDFVKGTDPLYGGSATKYTILANSALGAVTGPEADDIWVARTLAYQPNVEIEGNLELSFSENYPKVLDSLEGIMPLFEIANPKNMVNVQSFSQD